MPPRIGVGMQIGVSLSANVWRERERETDSQNERDRHLLEPEVRLTVRGEREPPRGVFTLTLEPNPQTAAPPSNSRTCCSLHE